MRKMVFAVGALLLLAAQPALAFSLTGYPPVPSGLVQLKDISSGMPRPTTPAEKQATSAWINRYANTSCKSDYMMGKLSSKNPTKYISETIMGTTLLATGLAGASADVRVDGNVYLYALTPQDAATGVMVFVPNVPENNKIFFAACNVNAKPKFRPSAKVPDFAK